MRRRTPGSSDATRTAAAMTRRSRASARGCRPDRSGSARTASVPSGAWRPEDRCGRRPRTSDRNAGCRTGSHGSAASSAPRPCRDGPAHRSISRAAWLGILCGDTDRAAPAAVPVVVAEPHVGQPVVVGGLEDVFGLRQLRVAHRFQHSDAHAGVDQQLLGGEVRIAARDTASGRAGVDTQRVRLVRVRRVIEVRTSARRRYRSATACPSTPRAHTT